MFSKTSGPSTATETALSCRRCRVLDAAARPVEPAVRCDCKETFAWLFWRPLEDTASCEVDECTGRNALKQSPSADVTVKFTVNG